MVPINTTTANEPEKNQGPGDRVDRQPEMSGPAARRSTSDLLTTIVVCSVVVCVFFSGFLNLVDIRGGYPATFILDGLTLLMAALLIVGFVRNPVWRRPSWWILALLASALVYCALSFFGEESLYVKLLALRDHVVYATVAVYIATFVKRRVDAEFLLRLTLRLGVGAAVFGLLQFSLRGILPSWLLKSRDTDSFGYYGTDLVRSTGLMGNTIIFSAIMLMFFAVFTFKLVYDFRRRDLVAAALVFCAILTTFSRVSIAGGLAVLVAAFIAAMVHRRSVRRALAWVGGGVAAGLGALASMWLTTPGAVGTGGTASTGFPGISANPSTEGSTVAHINSIQEALKSFKVHPLFGIGIGSQSHVAVHTPAHEKITDGAFWIALVEGGVALALVLVVAAIIFAATLISIWKRGGSMRYVAAGLAVFTIFQLGFASFFNTAFYGKNEFLLYWVLFGLVVAMARIETRRTIVHSES